MDTIATGYEPYLIEVTGTDEPFEDGRITAIQERRDGWSCTVDGGVATLVPRLPITAHGHVLRAAVTPRVGDRLRLYGSRGQLAGVVVGEQVVYYRDAAQRAAFARRVAEDEAARKAREAAVADEALGAQFAALPAFFQERIVRLRQANAEFHAHDERGEVFASAEAAKIAARARTHIGTGSVTTAEEAVRAFHQLAWAAQKEVLPELSDAHTYDSLDHACALALAYLHQQERETVPA